MKKMIILLFCGLCFGLELSDLKGLKDEKISGNFTQSKNILNFKKPIVTSGNYEFKDNELLWNTTEPSKNLMKINKDGIYNFMGNEWVKSEANYDKGLFLKIINFDFEALKDDFDIALNGDKSAWSAHLEPKNVWIKKVFKDIVIKGAKKVESIEINEQNGDKSFIKL